MRLSPNSLRFKISVLAILILAVILVIYSASLFFSFRYLLYQELDDDLLSKAQKIHSAVVSYVSVLGDDQESFEFSVNRVVSQTGEHPHENKIQKLEELWLGQARPLGLSSDYIIFLDASKRTPIARSRNLNTTSYLVSDKEIQSAQKGRTVFANVRYGSEHLRAVLLPVTYEKRLTDKRYLILVATSRERLIHALKERLIFKTMAVLSILLIASLLSQLFVIRVLRPVQEITRAAKAIDYKDLSRRIHLEDVDDEMKDLVNSLNQMMARLERSFKYIAEFSSNVSHELKTPLAILRGESELALRSAHSAEEYRKMVLSNLEEIKRMTKIIDDLLLLTKLDYQPEVFKFETFDLTDFFREIGESIKILADQKDMTVEVKIPEERAIRFRGDKVHLRRLFFNLINNAIKFTPPKGTIALRVSAQGKSALVSVSDTGPGISESDLPHIFEKFFHRDGAGTDGKAGNGLGLSIAQSIARIHNGDIQVQSVVGKGTTFTVQLPL